MPIEFSLPGESSRFRVYPDGRIESAYADGQWHPWVAGREESVSRANSIQSAAQAVTGLQPAGNAPSAPSAPSASERVGQEYDQAVTEARTAYQNASTQLQYVQNQLDAIPEPDDVSPGSPGEASALQRKQLQGRLESLQKTYSDAQQGYVTVLRQRADAVNKAVADADPAKQAQLQAQAKADIARASQVDAEAREFTSPQATADRRAQAAADVRIKTAQADQADLELSLARETDPLKRQQLQAQIDAQKAATAKIVADTGQVGKPAPRTPEQQRADAAAATAAEANASVAPAVASANAATAAANATTATANAAIAPDLAATNLRKAQADADKAALDLQDAQRKARQAPTDQQAQAAIATAQQAADLANQNLAQQIAQAKDLSPIALQQAQATLERSKQSIQQAKQGDLYGRQDQIQQIKSLVASGDIKPEEADGMVAALNRGTTVFQAQQQAQADRSTARGQDVTNLSTRAGVFNNFANTAGSIYNQMNSQGRAGSDASGRAFLAMLHMAQQAASQYTLPTAASPDYLGSQPTQPSPVGAMVGMAQQQIAQPVQPAPTPVQPTPVATPPQPQAPTGAHQVTINIGAPQQPQVSSGTEGQGNPWVGGNTPAPGTTWQNPALSGLVSQAAQKVPATEDDIRAAYGVQKPQAAGVM